MVLKVDASACLSSTGVTWLCPNTLLEGHSMVWNTVAFCEDGSMKRRAAFSWGYGGGLQGQAGFEMGLEEREGYRWAEMGRQPGADTMTDRREKRPI